MSVAVMLSLVASPTRSPALVLLHGFTQTAASWGGVVAALGERYRPLTPDLRGHGAHWHVRPVSFDAVVADVAALARGRPLVLGGYSMGGRLALHAALALAPRVRGLVLIGASPGLADPAQRVARRRADLALAAEIESVPLETFARRWAAQPLFAGQAAEVAAFAHADRMRNHPAGLAAALRGLGTGVMEPLWTRLGELALPVELVVGERDAKFRAVAEAMAGELPQARLHVIAGAGHAAQLEAPAAVAAILRELLDAADARAAHPEGQRPGIAPCRLLDEQR